MSQAYGTLSTGNCNVNVVLQVTYNFSGMFPLPGHLAICNKVSSPRIPNSLWDSIVILIHTRFARLVTYAMNCRFVAYVIHCNIFTFRRSPLLQRRKLCSVHAANYFFSSFSWKLQSAMKRTKSIRQDPRCVFNYLSRSEESEFENLFNGAQMTTDSGLMSSSYNQGPKLSL